MTTSVVPIRVHEMEMVVASEPMRQVMAMVERVAATSGAVLISGETGVGKELVARAIHSFSLRCGKPWVDVNCAAIPEHLVESELFGFEKGAFSGADSGKAGRGRGSGCHFGSLRGHRIHQGQFGNRESGSVGSSGCGARASGAGAGQLLDFFYLASRSGRDVRIACCEPDRGSRDID